MTDVTQDMIDRLPRWARTELAKRDAELVALRAQLDALASTGTRIIANPYALPLTARPFGLDDGTTVRFVLDLAHPSEGVDVSLRDDRVYVSAPSGALAIVPRSSNVVVIGVVDLHTGR